MKTTVFPEHLKTVFRAVKTVLDEDEQSVVSEALKVIADDSSITPEDKLHLPKLLEVAPDPAYTARRIIKSAEEEELLLLVYHLREGIKALQTGGAGRPRNASAESSTESEAASSNEPTLSVSENRSSSRSTSSTVTGSKRRKRSTVGQSQDSRDSRWAQRLRQRMPVIRCEITGETVRGNPRARMPELHLEGGHLIPAKSTSNERCKKFWMLLRWFWPDWCVDELLELCKNGFLNTYTNGVLMKDDVHRSFDNLDFYLTVDYEAATDEAYELTFHWRMGQGFVHNHWNPVRIGKATYWGYFEGNGTEKFQIVTQDAAAAPLPEPSLWAIRSVLARAAFPNDKSPAGTTQVSWQEYSSDRSSYSSRSDASNRHAQNGKVSLMALLSKRREMLGSDDNPKAKREEILHWARAVRGSHGNQNL